MAQDASTNSRVLSGEAAGGIAGAVAQALVELSTEWGVAVRGGGIGHRQDELVIRLRWARF